MTDDDIFGDEMERDIPAEEDADETIIESFEKLPEEERKDEDTPLSAIQAQGDLAQAVERLEAWGLTLEEVNENVIKVTSFVDHHTLSNMLALAHTYNACSVEFDTEEGLVLAFGSAARL